MPRGIFPRGPTSAVAEEAHMLGDYAIHPSLATADIGRARRWYAERLDLTPVLAFPSLLAYQVDDTMFTVYETPAAGTAQNTVMIWRVPNLQSEVARLRARGVAFEDLDLGDGDRTIDGIATTADPFAGTDRNAWFRDGDGNWISLVEQPDHPGEPPGQMGVGAAIAVKDLTRARNWYAEKLGLEPAHVAEDELVYNRPGGTGFTMFETSSAGTAKNTVAVWRVADLRAEVATLRSRGVQFLDVEIGGVKTVDGIYVDPDGDELTAWFSDPDGNVLGLAEDREMPLLPR